MRKKRTAASLTNASSQVPSRELILSSRPLWISLPVAFQQYFFSLFLTFYLIINKQEEGKTFTFIRRDGFTFPQKNENFDQVGSSRSSQNQCVDPTMWFMWSMVVKQKASSAPSCSFLADLGRLFPLREGFVGLAWISWLSPSHL